MEYTVQKGDTIANITKLLGTDWQTLKKMNPSAVGKSSRNGNWFLKEGKNVSVSHDFKAVLAQETTAQKKMHGAPHVTAPADKKASGRELIHTVMPGETVWELAVKRYHVHPEEVLRLNNISDPRKLQPGQELRIAMPEKQPPKSIVASWYGEYHHGLPMANGEPYDMYGHTIAHKQMPLGTRVELENPRTGKKVRAVVADRGPYVNGRDVDLSYKLAQELSIARQGVGNLIMRVL